MIDPSTFNFDKLDITNKRQRNKFIIINMIVIVTMVIIGYNAIKSKIIYNEKDK